MIFGFLLNFSLKRFNEARVKDISVHLLQSKQGDRVYFIEKKKVYDFIMQKIPNNQVGEVNIPDLEMEVNRFPSVDSANVYLGLDGVLHVDIQQRIPRFRLKKGEQQFYVDTNNEEFPISKLYAHPSMLVMGDVRRSEYPQVSELVEVLNHDDFCKKFFVGIVKEAESYYLLTADGDYKVELGDLDHLKFKIKGFKTFVEKILVYQPPKKYSKISVRYDNQIVTTIDANM